MIKVICKQCNKEFEVYPYRTRIGVVKFCSYRCYWKYVKLDKSVKGNKNPNWKGCNVGYAGLHKWFQREFGKADKCEGSECSGISNKYHWALLKGKEYERKRENFWMLCDRCHGRYDMIGNIPWNKGLKLSNF